MTRTFLGRLCVVYEEGGGGGAWGRVGNGASFTTLIGAVRERGKVKAVLGR